jgi:hypothetical protein
MLCLAARDRKGLERGRDSREGKSKLENERICTENRGAAAMRDSKDLV